MKLLMNEVTSSRCGSHLQLFGPIRLAGQGRGGVAMLSAGAAPVAPLSLSCGGAMSGSVSSQQPSGAHALGTRQSLRLVRYEYRG